MNTKKIILIVGLTVTLIIKADPVKCISLNPDIIAIIDGKSIGIYGELVGAVYKIARDIQAMQLGKFTPQGRIGMYLFRNQQHSIHSLATMEQQCIINQDEQGIKDIQELLIKIRQEFYAVVSPFLGQAQAAKGPMYLLISESCTKRNRPDSLLLDWAKSTEDESIALQKAITKFELFDQFCTDLVNFLGDLLHSCPKARAQFEQLKEEYIRRQRLQ